MCELQSFRAELIHRDHPDSPLRPPAGTDRLAAAAARSKARRRLAGGSEVADATPVAPGSEEYLMTIHLGTPPQKFVMIVDSGSDLVWVQCLPCNAPHVCFPSPNPYFDPSASSSYAAVPCNSSQCDPLQVIPRSTFILPLLNSESHTCTTPSSSLYRPLNMATEEEEE
jgi:saccharopepsin